MTAEDQTTILRLLAERRDDLVGERPRILNRLHGLLCDLLPGGAPSNLTADKGRRAAARPTPADRDRRLPPAAGPRPARRPARVEARLADNKVQAGDALAATASTLTQVQGLGVVLAAMILGHVGDIGRFPCQDHFASYTATARLDASSGNQQCHRLNPGGNRQLNAALHTIAVCQARDPGPGRRYYLHKLNEGKTQPKPAERSSDAWPTSSTGASWPTNADPTSRRLTNRGAVGSTRDRRPTSCRRLWVLPMPLAEWRSSTRTRA